MQKKLETCLTWNNKKIMKGIYTAQCDKFTIYLAKISYKVQVCRFSVNFVKTLSISLKVLLNDKMVRFCYF